MVHGITWRSSLLFLCPCRCCGSTQIMKSLLSSPFFGSSQNHVQLDDNHTATYPVADCRSLGEASQGDDCEAEPLPHHRYLQSARSISTRFNRRIEPPLPRKASTYATVAKIPVLVTIASPPAHPTAVRTFSAVPGPEKGSWTGSPLVRPLPLAVLKVKPQETMWSIINQVQETIIPRGVMGMAPTTCPILRGGTYPSLPPSWPTGNLPGREGPSRL